MAGAPTELTISAASIDSLPDELLAEVMLRVPTPAALVHAAAASRRWRSVVATGKFLGDYRVRHWSSPLLGIYVPREFEGLPSFQMADSIRSADVDRDLQRAAARAFILSGLESHSDWRLLDCHNGRLLLARGGDEPLVVYSPLSRECILVPLPWDDFYPSACLLPGHGDAASFRVFFVQHRRRRGDRMVRAVEYDSRGKNWEYHPWEILKNIEETVQGKLTLMHAGNLIFCKSMGSSLLLLDTTKMEFSDLPLPGDKNPKHYSIGEMEDGVCCLASVESVGTSNKCHLRVWKLDQQNWKLEKEMGVNQVLQNHLHGMYSYYTIRAVTNGIALLCSNHHLHFLVDLKTFNVKETFEFVKDIAAYPMQMPWPPAFSVATVAAARDLGSSVGNTDKRPELRDGAAPSAPEDLDGQYPVATVPRPSAAEECFQKENSVSNDYDLEALIPDLCDQVSGLMHPEATRFNYTERRMPLTGLQQGAQCPFAASNGLHPKYCIKDPKSPHIQEGKPNWGPIQVCIKKQRCLEDWDYSEGENSRSSEWDHISLKGGFHDCMQLQQMNCSNQCVNGMELGGVEHGYVNGRLQEFVSVEVTVQPEDSLEPDGASCNGVQNPLTMQADLDGQHAESKLNKDPEMPSNDDVVIPGCSHDHRSESRDETAVHNSVASNAVGDLGIQEPIATELTTAQAEECFDKKSDVSNGHGLELIPDLDRILCYQDPLVHHREAEAQYDEGLSSNAAQPHQRGPGDKRRSNRARMPNPRVQGSDWIQ